MSTPRKDKPPKRHLELPVSEKRRQEASKAAKRKRREERKRRVIEALEKTLGNITMAAKIAKVDPSIVYRWKRDDLDFKKKVEAIDDRAIDFVEGCLMKNIKDGDRTCQIFYLKTKGRKRGWAQGQGKQSGGVDSSGEALSEDGAISQSFLEEEIPAESLDDIFSAIQSSRAMDNLAKDEEERRRNEERRPAAKKAAKKKWAAKKCAKKKTAKKNPNNRSRNNGNGNGGGNGGKNK